jgi:Tfp pilus assembly protein PilN
MSEHEDRKTHMEAREEIELQKLHVAMKRASDLFTKRDRAAKLLDELLRIVPKEHLQPAIDWVLEKEEK